VTNIDQFAVKEIAFIDPAISDCDTLIAGLRPEIAAIRLDASTPAPAQIARALAGRHGLRAIHIIAHGAPGEVSFAAGTLSRDTIADHANDIARIGEALDSDGELLLWSCATGQGPRGERFIGALARATDADVAAATGVVGAAARGGRWELDACSGATAAQAPLTAAGVALYAAVLVAKTYIGPDHGQLEHRCKLVSIGCSRRRRHRYHRQHWSS
jgi:collagen type VII alpha